MDQDQELIEEHLIAAYGLRQRATSEIRTPEDEELQEGEALIVARFKAAAAVASITEATWTVELASTRVRTLGMRFLFSSSTSPSTETNQGGFYTEITWSHRDPTTSDESCGTDVVSGQVLIPWIPRLAEAAFVFPAALALCDLIARDDVLLRSQKAGGNFLELGSGTGVVGIVASGLGHHVVCTDIGDAVSAMRHTFEREGMDRAHVCARELPWGVVSQEALSAVCVYGPPEYVLCADLIHDRGLHEALLDTLWALCGNGVAQAVVSFQQRDPEKEAAFLRLASSSKYSFKITDCSDYLIHSISVHLLNSSSPTQT